MMKTITRKEFLGVTNSGVEPLASGAGFVFVKSEVPLVGYYEHSYKPVNGNKTIKCSSTFNRQLYGD